MTFRTWTSPKSGRFQSHILGLVEQWIRINFSLQITPFIDYPIGWLGTKSPGLSPCSSKHCLVKPHSAGNVDVVKSCHKPIHRGTEGETCHSGLLAYSTTEQHEKKARVWAECTFHNGPQAYLCLTSENCPSRRKVLSTKFRTVLIPHHPPLV